MRSVLWGGAEGVVDVVSVNDSDRTLTKKQIYSTLQINNYRTNFNNKNAKMDT